MKVQTYDYISSPHDLKFYQEIPKTLGHVVKNVKNLFFPNNIQNDKLP